MAASFRPSHCFTLGTVLLALAASTRAAELRLGIIGLDTSHVVAFTRLLNAADDPKHVPGARVTVAFKSASPDLPSSIGRVEGYAQQLQTNFGVRLVESVEALCAEVDAVLLENVDGRPHLELARPVFRARKPVFIDKPVAGTLRDAVAIYRLARESRTPVFTASAYRFYESLQTLKRTDVGRVRGAISYGPCELEPHHPDLYWYGIHPTEALFTVLGPGCETVARVTTTDTDIVTGRWGDGRTGLVYGLRNGAAPHKVLVFGTRSVGEQQGSGDYAPLVREIVKFFQTGAAPVLPEEWLEIYAFMEAADASKRQGGVPVKVAEVLAKNGWQGPWPPAQ